MLAMINDFRAGSDAWEWKKGNTEKVYHSGLQPLTYDYKLEQVAMQRAAEIALSYSHTRLDGSSHAWDSFSGWTDVGENIAAGYGTASSVFAGWQETDEPYEGQGHRRNMLKESFTAVGIGHVVCNGYHYWVQVFCAPVLDSAQTPAVDAARDVELTVANSIVSHEGLSVSPTAITLHPGESVVLPSVSTKLGTKETWPEKKDSPEETAMPVKVSSVSWSTADAGVASISNGMVVANKVGETSLKASAQLSNEVTDSVTVNVVAWDISDASITGLSAATYNGSAHKPAPKVTSGSKTLKAGTDYSVSYKNNVKAGTATVTITGMGDYSGKKSATFAIAAAPLSSATVSGITGKTYTGKAITQSAKLTFYAKTLKAGTDYSVSYKNNVKAGTASVVFTGKGNFKGSVTKTFKIAKAKNPLKASAKSKTLSVKYSKKKATTIKKAKAFKVTGSKGSLTFKKLSGSKKIEVSKAGKITVAKATAKKLYTVKVKVTAAGNANYKKASKTVTLKIRVK